MLIPKTQLSRPHTNLTVRLVSTPLGQFWLPSLLLLLLTLTMKSFFSLRKNCVPSGKTFFRAASRKKLPIGLRQCRIANAFYELASIRLATMPYLSFSRSLRRLLFRCNFLFKLQDEILREIVILTIFFFFFSLY